MILCSLSLERRENSFIDELKPQVKYVIRKVGTAFFSTKIVQMNVVNCTKERQRL